MLALFYTILKCKTEQAELGIKLFYMEETIRSILKQILEIHKKIFMSKYAASGDMVGLQIKPRTITLVRNLIVAAVSIQFG